MRLAQHNIRGSRRLGAGLLIASVTGLAAMSGGCANDAQAGAGIGAGLGAIGGAIIGHQSGHAGEGAAIGAGVGAVGGYIVGNESDKARERQRRHDYDY